MKRQLKVIADFYDFMLWLIRHTEKFPRHHRYSLGVAHPSMAQNPALKGPPKTAQGNALGTERAKQNQALQGRDRGMPARHGLELDERYGWD